MHISKHVIKTFNGIEGCVTGNIELFKIKGRGKIKY